MSLDKVNEQTVKGHALKELQGLSIAVVAGATAGTKMDVAPLRDTDFLLAAVVSTDAGGALANDVANITIQSVKASGTLTFTSNPADNDTIVVNGVTYRFKTTPVALNDILRSGTVTQVAEAVVKAVNAYENRFNGNGFNVARVKATNLAGVVTIKAVVDGDEGNDITLTESASNTAASGSGTLAGGTDTGGIKSTTNLANKSIILVYFKKPVTSIVINPVDEE